MRAEWLGTPIKIFDTAGMRKKARINEKLEKLSVSDGIRAVRFAEVVVVLLDVDIPFEVQDLRIADFAETEGRAVVIAVNKWDLEDEKQEKLAELKEMFERLLPQLRGAPMITVSGKTGRGLDRLHDAILKAHEVWNRRIPTARLNTWLGAMIESHPPPAPQRAAHQAALHDASQAAPAGVCGDVLATPMIWPTAIAAIWSTACASISTCPARRSG